MTRTAILAVTCHDKGTNTVGDDVSPISTSEHGGRSSTNNVEFCFGGFIKAWYII